MKFNKIIFTFTIIPLIGIILFPNYSYSLRVPSSLQGEDPDFSERFRSAASDEGPASSASPLPSQASSVLGLMENLKDVLVFNRDTGFEILDEAKLRLRGIGYLTREASLNPNPEIREAAQYINHRAQLLLGLAPASEPIAEDMPLSIEVASSRLASGQTLAENLTIIQGVEKGTIRVGLEGLALANGYEVLGFTPEELDGLRQAVGADIVNKVRDLALRDIKNRLSAMLHTYENRWHVDRWFTNVGTPAYVFYLGKDVTGLARVIEGLGQQDQDTVMFRFKDNTGFTRLFNKAREVVRRELPVTDGGEAVSIELLDQVKEHLGTLELKFKMDTGQPLWLKLGDVGSFAEQLAWLQTKTSPQEWRYLIGDLDPDRKQEVVDHLLMIAEKRAEERAIGATRDIASDDEPPYSFEMIYGLDGELLETDPRLFDSFETIGGHILPIVDMRIRQQQEEMRPWQEKTVERIPITHPQVVFAASSLQRLTKDDQVHVRRFIRSQRDEYTLIGRHALDWLTYVPLEEEQRVVSTRDMDSLKSSLAVKQARGGPFTAEDLSIGLDLLTLTPEQEEVVTAGVDEETVRGLVEFTLGQIRADFRDLSGRLVDFDVSAPSQARLNFLPKDVSNSRRVVQLDLQHWVSVMGDFSDSFIAAVGEVGNRPFASGEELASNELLKGIKEGVEEVENRIRAGEAVTIYDPEAKRVAAMFQALGRADQISVEGDLVDKGTARRSTLYWLRQIPLEGRPVNSLIGTDDLKAILKRRKGPIGQQGDAGALLIGYDLLALTPDQQFYVTTGVDKTIVDEVIAFTTSHIKGRLLEMQKRFSADLPVRRSVEIDLARFVSGLNSREWNEVMGDFGEEFIGAVKDLASRSSRGLASGEGITFLKGIEDMIEKVEALRLRGKRDGIRVNITDPLVQLAATSFQRLAEADQDFIIEDIGDGTVSRHTLDWLRYIPIHPERIRLGNTMSISTLKDELRAISANQAEGALLDSPDSINILLAYDLLALSISPGVLEEVTAGVSEEIVDAVIKLGLDSIKDRLEFRQSEEELDSFAMLAVQLDLQSWVYVMRDFEEELIDIIGRHGRRASDQTLASNDGLRRDLLESGRAGYISRDLALQVATLGVEQQTSLLSAVDDEFTGLIGMVSSAIWEIPAIDRAEALGGNARIRVVALPADFAIDNGEIVVGMHDSLRRADKKVVIIIELGQGQDLLDNVILELRDRIEAGEISLVEVAPGSPADEQFKNLFAVNANLIGLELGDVDVIKDAIEAVKRAI